MKRLALVILSLALSGGLYAKGPEKEKKEKKAKHHKHHAKGNDKDIGKCTCHKDDDGDKNGANKPPIRSGIAENPL